MVDPTEAESALKWLEEHAREHARLYGNSLRKERAIDKMEALLIKGLANQNVPVTVRKAYARADERYQEALDEATEAKIKLVEHEDLRDTAKLRISLYQSQVKDRL
jgi:hypothetical protein